MLWMKPTAMRFALDPVMLTDESTEIPARFSMNMFLPKLFGCSSLDP